MRVFCGTYHVYSKAKLLVTLFQTVNSEVHFPNDHDYLAFFDNAKTDDLTDLRDKLQPNLSEYQLWGHQSDDLIAQCTFDRENCDM